MAERKRRTFTTAEKLEKVEAQISEVEETLKQLKAQKKELLEKKKQEDIEAIYEIISASGKSLEEVKKLLSRD